MSDAERSYLTLSDLVQWWLILDDFAWLCQMLTDPVCSRLFLQRTRSRVSIKAFPVSSLSYCTLTHTHTQSHSPPLPFLPWKLQPDLCRNLSSFTTSPSASCSLHNLLLPHSLHSLNLVVHTITSVLPQPQTWPCHPPPPVGARDYLGTVTLWSGIGAGGGEGAGWPQMKRRTEPAPNPRLSARARLVCHIISYCTSLDYCPENNYYSEEVKIASSWCTVYTLYNK
jgi:hypothetical protein